MLHDGLPQERTGLPHELAVRIDLAFLAEVADHVPVQAGAVLAAGLREAGAERDVDRAADLLVEEDVPREAVDLVVEAERALPEEPRLGVHVQDRLEVLATACGLRRDDLAALEPQTDVLDGVAVEDRGKAEADLALRP